MVKKLRRFRVNEDAFLNNREEPVSFAGENGHAVPTIICSIEKDNRVIRADAVLPLSGMDQIPANGSIRKEIAVPVSGLPKGEYRIYFGIRMGKLPDAILSEGKIVQLSP